MGGSVSSGFTQCNVVEENEVCSFWKVKEAGYDAGWGNCWRCPSTLRNSVIFLVGSHLLFLTFNLSHSYIILFPYFFLLSFFTFQILLSLFPSVLFPLTPFFHLFFFCHPLPAFFLFLLFLFFLDLLFYLFAHSWSMHF